MSKLKTVAASFTYTYADTQPLAHKSLRKMRLFRETFGGNTQDLPLQYIKLVRLAPDTVIERLANGDFYQQSNSSRQIVAIIGGDMLDADNGTFYVAYFGFGEGSGYRYSRFTGLAAAEAAVERWAKRKYRVAVESSVIERIQAEVSKQAGFEIDTQVEPLGTGQDFAVSVAGEIRKTFANLRHTAALTFLLAGYNSDTDRTGMTVNVKSFAAL